MGVKAVEVRAQLLRIRTRADRTSDVTLNIPEDCTEQVKVLLGWLMDEVDVILAQRETLTDFDDETRKEPERRNSKVGRRRA
jgi:hypothetical protein